MNGLLAILLKEFAHIRREPATLFFAFAIPVLQLTVFGFAIDMTIEDIRTVIFDLDGRDDARRVVESLVNTRTFKLVGQVENQDEFNRALSSGRAQVGVKIPPDYTDRLTRGEQATVQVIIDGSDSQVASTALHSAQLLGLNLSMRRGRQFAESLQVAPARGPTGDIALPIEMRPRLMFNPDLESAHFFVPALVGIILQLVTLFLTAFSVVRERERGTLEQLFVTPVGRAGLLIGKLVPYALMGFIETLIVLLVMVFVFGVPIHGSITLLLTLVGLFLLTSLGMGLFVSTVARTQVLAFQLGFIIMLPSILLSGFIFPREGMPWPIWLISFALPATYFIEILRGIILRSADLRDLLPQVWGLAACFVVVMSLSLLRFRKQLD